MGTAFCSNCGTEISDQAVSCPKCGHPGPGARPLGIPTPGGPVEPGPGGVPLAEWWQRVVAAVIDAVIVAIPSYILGGLILFRTSSLGFGSVFGPFLLILAAGVAYRVVLEGGPKGQTVGKMVMKIRVVDAAGGGSIGYGRAFARWIVASLLWALFYIPGIIDALFPLWDPKRQSIHDKAANSLVVVAP